MTSLRSRRNDVVIEDEKMDRLGRIALILSTCLISTSAVKLNVRFLIDFDTSGAKSAAPELIWRKLARSDLIGRHLAATYSTGVGQCDLDGVKKMMRNFTPKDVNDIHAFIGPICSYMCDLTGLMSSAYSIPQVREVTRGGSIQGTLQCQ